MRGWQSLFFVFLRLNVTIALVTRDAQVDGIAALAACAPLNVLAFVTSDGAAFIAPLAESLAAARPHPGLTPAHPVCTAPFVSRLSRLFTSYRRDA